MESKLAGTGRILHDLKRERRSKIPGTYPLVLATDAPRYLDNEIENGPQTSGFSSALQHNLGPPPVNSQLPKLNYHFFKVLHFCAVGFKNL